MTQMVSNNAELIPAGARRLAPERFRVYTERNMDELAFLDRLPAEARFDMRVVASVLPFRVNEYVIDNLIDWDRVPDDPVFQLTFPQRGMLGEAAFERMATLLRSGPTAQEIRALANELRADLNPHPAGQQTLNVPRLDGRPLEGMQHKYRETVLFFPAHGQTCHAYCTFCFRWAQFVGDKDLKFAASEVTDLHEYLARHREVSDLLVTGGDPMVMKTRHLRNYLEPLLEPRFAHVQTIRIGTKAISYWPQRFVTDEDADELMRLIEQLSLAGKHVAVMAHLNHWQEVDTPIAARAIARLREAGATIRAQAPVLAHINDNAEAWAQLWRNEVRHGIVPYYMFVERDTGARAWFEVPLVKTWEIYRDAIQQVSGLARTARGPSMSAEPGKVEVQGVTEIAGERVLALRFIQGRNPDWVQRPFFARYDSEATWLDQLRPAFGEAQFFFEPELEAMRAAND